MYAIRSYYGIVGHPGVTGVGQGGARAQGRQEPERQAQATCSCFLLDVHAGLPEGWSAHATKHGGGRQAGRSRATRRSSVNARRNNFV